MSMLMLCVKGDLIIRIWPKKLTLTKGWGAKTLNNSRIKIEEPWQCLRGAGWPPHISPWCPRKTRPAPGSRPKQQQEGIGWVSGFNQPDHDKWRRPWPKSWTSKIFGYGFTVHHENWLTNGRKNPVCKQIHTKSHGIGRICGPVLIVIYKANKGIFLDRSHFQ